MHSTISPKEKLRLSDPWTSWPMGHILNEKQHAWNFHWIFLLAWWCSTSTSDQYGFRFLEPGCELVSVLFLDLREPINMLDWRGAHRIWQAVIAFWTALMFTNARFFSKLGFTDMMESTTKRRLCMSGLQVLRSQTWSVRWSSAQKFRKVNVYMSAALAEASSAAVASGANVERQTLGLRELFQPGHKGCLTTPGLTKPIRTPSWLLLRAALPMMNWSGSAPWVPMFRETAGIVTPKSTLFYSILECFETIGVPCPNWQFWSILGGQPLKASWHRLVFLLPLRC